MLRLALTFFNLVDLAYSSVTTYTSTISAGEDFNSGLELASPDASAVSYASNSLSVCLRLDLSVVGSAHTHKARLLTMAYPPRPEDHHYAKTYVLYLVGYSPVSYMKFGTTIKPNGIE